MAYDAVSYCRIKVDIDIYLLQLGFHPVAVVGRLVKEIGKRPQKENQ